MEPVTTADVAALFIEAGYSPSGDVMQSVCATIAANSSDIYDAQERVKEWLS